MLILHTPNPKETSTMRAFVKLVRFKVGQIHWDSNNSHYFYFHFAIKICCKNEIYSGFFTILTAVQYDAQCGFSFMQTMIAQYRRENEYEKASFDRKTWDVPPMNFYGGYMYPWSPFVPTPMTRWLWTTGQAVLKQSRHFRESIDSTSLHEGGSSTGFIKFLSVLSIIISMQPRFLF